MTKERQEKNQILAEWLGFRRLADSIDSGLIQWHHHECKCEANAPEDTCRCHEGCYLSDDNDPPDFYTSEYASALLLENIPDATLMREDRTWMCCERGGSFKMDDARKTAIAEATLAYIESLASQGKR